MLKVFIKASCTKLLSAWMWIFESFQLVPLKDTTAEAHSRCKLFSLAETITIVSRVIMCQAIVASPANLSEQYC